MRAPCDAENAVGRDDFVMNPAAPWDRGPMR